MIPRAGPARALRLPLLGIAAALWVLGVLWLAGLPASVSGQEPDPAAPPEGEGRDLVRFHCSICHDLAIVRQQRLSEGVWDEVLEDMLTFGAVFGDAQRAVILKYLATRFGQ